MPSKAPISVVPCAGVSITACGRTAAAKEVIRLTQNPLDRGADIHLCNAYTLALADRDSNFKELLNRATMNFPDGMAVVWANRWKHKSLELPKERVYGPDLFLDVFASGQQGGVKHYLLGSTPEVLNRLATELLKRFPDAQIVGCASPPFRELTARERLAQAADIRSSGAQIVWVGLGTPKQDWEVANLSRELPCVFVAVGAAFDFVAGTKSQAPRWMQEHGLEWAFRLASEPRRLWKRYLLGNARFVRATFHQ